MKLLKKFVLLVALVGTTSSAFSNEKPQEEESAQSLISDASNGGESYGGFGG